MGKNALNEVKVRYTLIELDECGEARNGEVQQMLQQMTGRKTVPNVLVNGRSIGGGTELAELKKRGELKRILTDAGCPFLGSSL